MSTMIKVKTKALEYIKTAVIVTEEYNNGSLYIGLYDRTGELYTDLSTYIMPVLPDVFFVEQNSEKQRFCNEQNTLFQPLETTVKSGFNTYQLYKFIRG